MNDVGKLLARSQLGLSVLFIVGYFGLWVLAGLHKITPDAPKDVTPFVGMVAYFWFQRTRPQSADDPSPDPNPTSPPQAAKP